MHFHPFLCFYHLRVSTAPFRHNPIPVLGHLKVLQVVADRSRAGTRPSVSDALLVLQGTPSHFLVKRRNHSTHPFPCLLLGFRVIACGSRYVLTRIFWRRLQDCFSCVPWSICQLCFRRSSCLFFLSNTLLWRGHLCFHAVMEGRRSRHLALWAVRRFRSGALLADLHAR